MIYLCNSHIVNIIISLEFFEASYHCSHLLQHQFIVKFVILLAFSQQKKIILKSKKKGFKKNYYYIKC